MIYLGSPLQNEILNICHNLSHNLSMPSYIISHDYEVNSRQLNKLPEPSYMSDSHRLLDDLALALNQDTDESDTEFPSTKNVKVDKHVCSNNYKLRICVYLEHTALIYNHCKILLLKHSKKEKIPPQIS